MPSQLLFAYDTALVADSTEQLQALVREFGRVCERKKLRVNVDKSKVMVTGRAVELLSLNIQLNYGRSTIFQVPGQLF